MLNAFRLSFTSSKVDGLACPTRRNVNAIAPHKMQIIESFPIIFLFVLIFFKGKRNNKCFNYQVLVFYDTRLYSVTLKDTINDYDAHFI